jgi:DNA-directed RNA polymerase specialized sigma24 family protein
VNQLYQRYYARTRGYARKALGRELADHADDIAQETWLDIIKRGYFPPLLDPPHPEVGRLHYLFRIVTRKVSRLRAKLQRENQKRELVQSGEQPTSGPRHITKRKCEICGRPCRRGRKLCEAHYFRIRRGAKREQLKIEVQTWRKLSVLQVAAIRAALDAGATGRSQASKYGVGEAQISRIRHRRQRI